MSEKPAASARRARARVTPRTISQGRRLFILLLLSSFSAVPAGADPRKAASATLGKPFAIRSGQEVALGSLKVRMTAEHRPIERGPGGVELFPYTYYRLEWREGADRLVIPQMSRRGKGQPNSQFELFGRYTFTFDEGRDEDEATLTVVKRWCLLRYTSANQLQHPD